MNYTDLMLKKTLRLIAILSGSLLLGVIGSVVAEMPVTYQQSSQISHN